MVYMPAGSVVTCEHGHPICRLARDVYFKGDPVDYSKDFKDWRQARPSLSTLPACEVCGARFVGGPDHDWAIHFQDGWRRPSGARTIN